MRILSIGNFGHGWDGSICDEEHIAKALEELGHEVYRMQREEFEDVHYIGDSLPGPFDFTLVAQWDGFQKCHIMDKTVIGCLGYHGDGKTRGTDFYGPIVYWAFDYQADDQEWHERLIREADLYLSHRIADSKYPNWQWFTQDFAPDFLDKHSEEVEKDIDVLFTGSYLPWAEERNEILKAIDDKFKLTICSVNGADFVTRGFKDVRRPAMDHELPELIAHAKINISIDHTIEAGYWSDRNAQTMACGGLVLFRYVPCSTAVFDDYVEYFHDIEGCLELIKFYLEFPKLAMLKARWGYKYAQDNLTVTERAKDLLTIVGSIL